VNLDIGIFPSYIGLYSYYNPDNWTYQASYVSSNTPWFFNGARLQIFPTKQLKTEFWLISGWQTYGVFNDKLAFGYQVKWANEAGWFSSVYNGYIGYDSPDSPNLMKLHSDNSWLIKDYDNPKSSFITKNAWSLTADLGGQQGDLGNGFLSCAVVHPASGTSCSGTNQPAAFCTWLKLSRTLIGGMIMSSTNDPTILPNAPPMITPTARSITLPRIANSLNSLSRLMGAVPLIRDLFNRAALHHRRRFGRCRSRPS